MTVDERRIPYHTATPFLKIRIHEGCAAPALAAAAGAAAAVAVAAVTYKQFILTSGAHPKQSSSGGKFR